MKKVMLGDVLNGKERLIGKNQLSSIYLLPDGQILKLFALNYLFCMKLIDADIEKKILSADDIIVHSNVILPTSAVYSNNGQFVGYTMLRANGINFNDNTDNLSIRDRSDLYKYAKLHYNLEQVVKTSSDIVFTDLCSCDNIYVDRNYNVQVIDYDDLQIKGIKSAIMSTSLGEPSQYINSKKYSANGLFTKELDVKSLIILYFLDVFNINLNKVGNAINPQTGKVITLCEILDMINLVDNDFNDKVWRIFKRKQSNEYLGEDMFRIADKYNMYIAECPYMKGTYFKVLRRK